MIPAALRGDRCLRAISPRQPRKTAMTQPSPMGTPLPWNLVASAYANEIVPIFEQYASDALRLAAPSPGSRILDVACGPGTLSAVAAARGHQVDALDFSPA